MDANLKQAYLYDFYGELLNEHQRRIYEEFHFQDLSLGEIAEEKGISRQGVADMVRRCRQKLEGYEAKLHLVEKFLKIRADAQQIEKLAGQLKAQPSQESTESCTDIPEQITALAHGIIEEL